MRAALLLLPLLAACQAPSPPEPPSHPNPPSQPEPAPEPAIPTLAPEPSDSRPPLPPVTATVVEAMDRESTPLQVGQILRITLKANPSTGYAWEVVQPLPPQLVREDADVLPQPPDAPARPQLAGAPQEQWIYLRAVAPGQAQVQLQWRRAWEKEQPAARTAAYRVNVR